MTKESSPKAEDHPLAPEDGRPVVILASGGIDSCVMIGRALDRNRPIYPLYIRQGTLWEDEEEAAIRRFLHAIDSFCRQRGQIPRLARLHVMRLDLPREYPGRWALDGSVRPPDATSPSEAVYLPGRNLGLLFLAALLAQSVGAESVQIGLLAGNPFSDSQPEFLNAFQQTYELATHTRIQIETPLNRFTKAQVLKEGAALPLHETFSCIRPVGGLHCGHCNKCAERRKGFVKADMADPTVYAGD